MGFFLFATLLATLQQGVNAQQPIVTADLILRNGRIRTDSDAGTVWSQALSIRNGNILSIGSNGAIEKERGTTTRVIDLKGRLVLPGFNDAHAHLVSGGLGLIRVDLSDSTASIAKIQEKVRAYAAAHPQKQWVFGGGWDPAVLPNRSPPTKGDVDAAVADKPVFLWSIDGQSALVNTKALELLKIDEPTGLLVGTAAHAAANKIDNPSRAELKQAFKLAQEQAVRYGVTSVQGGPIRGEDELQAVQELFDEGQLRIRYSTWGDLERLDEFIKLKEKHKSRHEEWIRLNTVKGFLDGVLFARTAALLEAYSDDLKAAGQSLLAQNRLNELVLAANRAGVAVALHAVGDRAVSMALTAFSNSKHLLFNSRIRNRIEHLEVVPPLAFPKFHELNVVASMMPSHLVYETEAQNYTPTRLGAKRSKLAFPTRSFVTARAHLAFGTDWPVMPLNPMIGLFAAVERRHLNGRPPSGWVPEQKINLEQALEAYSLGPAYATREEHVKGSLREGKYADLVVLEKDLFKIKSQEWLKTEVYMTIVNGKIVHDASQARISPAL